MSACKLIEMRLGGQAIPRKDRDSVPWVSGSTRAYLRFVEVRPGATVCASSAKSGHTHTKQLRVPCAANPNEKSAGPTRECFPRPGTAAAHSRGSCVLLLNGGAKSESGMPLHYRWIFNTWLSCPAVLSRHFRWCPAQARPACYVQLHDTAVAIRRRWHVAYPPRLPV